MILDTLENAKHYYGIHPGFEKAFEAPKLKQMLYGSAADWDFYHQLYLLYNISYYLLIYAKEKKVHVQAHWLVKTWDLAIRDFI